VQVEEFWNANPKGKQVYHREFGQGVIVTGHVWLGSQEESHETLVEFSDSLIGQRVVLVSELTFTNTN